MANTIHFDLSQMTAQPSNAEALYNFMQAAFDALVPQRVLSFTTTTPSGSEPEESVYVVASSGATGVFATHESEVAVKINGSWYFVDEVEGMSFYVVDEDARIWHDGTEWTYVGNASIETIAAAGNNSQANAAQLTREVAIVTGVVAATTTGVKLKAAKKGKRQVVYNADSADTLDVFPASGDAIDGQSADAKVTIPAGKCRIFWCLDATNWYSMLGA